MSEKEQVIEKQEEKETPETLSKVVDKPEQKTVKDPMVYDENGVPWKNRHYETVRRIKDLSSEVSELKQKINNPVKPTEEQWGTETESIKSSDVERIAEDKARKLFESERNSEHDMRNYLNNFQQVDPYVAKYRSEIEDKLSNLDRNTRSNPTAIQIIIKEVKGEHLDDILKESGSTQPSRRVVTEKKLSPVNDVTPTTPSNDTTRVVLSNEENRFANSRNLYDKGFTDTEIREMFNKDIERKKTKK
jgi:hypothetical protein